MALNDGTLVALGLIQKPRGLLGEVLVKPYQANSKSFRAGLQVVIKTEKTTLQTKIESARNSGKRVWLKFVNIGDRNEAITLSGGEIFCEFAQLPKSEPDEYYIFDLVGLKVVDSAGMEIGIVEDVLNLPANDLLIVKKDDNENMIPFIKSVIRSVKINKGVIEIANADSYLNDEN